MWQWNSVKTALDFMQKFGLNALILHQNEIMDDIVMPSRYFCDSEQVWQRWPVRMSKTYANAVYLRRVIDLARTKGIDVYLEVKEIWFHDSLLDIVPALRDTDGVVCPTNPFWFDFLRNKTEEVLERLPDLAGIIVSPATRESKVSISKRLCSCERCRNTSDQTWYEAYMKAVYEPLHRRGKRLVVRDFTYSVGQQDALLQAVESCAGDIVVALKNVPQDFWPTFPNNAKIGTISHTQWIEFDVWGQYCGIGVFPCSLVEDIQRRMRYCAERNARGVILRTDWEICNDASVFNSFNILNLIAAARLSVDPWCDLDEIYREWAQYGLYLPLTAESEAAAPVVPQTQDAWKSLRDFMRESYRIMEKALFIQGDVFQLSSKIQYSVRDILYTMEKHHSKGRWDGQGERTLKYSPERVDALLSEKQEALLRAEKLPRILKPEALGLPEAFVERIHSMLELYKLYIQQFSLAARIVLSSKLEDRNERIKGMTCANAELIAFAQQVSKKLEGTAYPYYVYWLLDAEKLREFAESNQRLIDSL